MGKRLMRAVVLCALAAGGSILILSLPFSLSARGEVDGMVENLHWIGHSSFRLEASKIIYFDPWKLPGDSKRADFIFVSHEHFDHCSADDISKISAKDTVIVASNSAARQLRGKINCKEIKSMSPGDSVEIGGVKVKAVYSYNTDKDFHPRESRKLGFIVTIDGVSIYHAGDTDNIPEMKGYGCDIALLPVSGTYVMTADEAARSAMDIKPKVAIPMHYGDIVGSSDDARRFKELLEGKIEVRVLSPAS